MAEFDTRSRECFEKACAFIDEAVSSHSPEFPVVVYVHCAGGVSRSASIVLWYLVKNGTPLVQAWQQLKDLREVIGPNAGFFNLLLDFEKELFGCETMHRPLTMHQRCYTAV
jgi:protein-tyrosine phosphatase